jgi:hypothetical protein
MNCQGEMILETDSQLGSPLLSFPACRNTQSTIWISIWEITN